MIPTIAHTVIFSSLDPSMKMYKCLGYLSLTFSNRKINGQVLFLWNLWSVKFMFGVQGGITGMTDGFLSNPYLLLQWLFPSGGQRVYGFFVLLE